MQPTKLDIRTASRCRGWTENSEGGNPAPLCFLPCLAQSLTLLSPFPKGGNVCPRNSKKETEKEILCERWAAWKDPQGTCRWKTGEPALTVKREFKSQLCRSSVHKTVSHSASGNKLPPSGGYEGSGQNEEGLGML